MLPRPLPQLPKPLRNGVRDAGICHFLTIFRARDGSLHQFDFGPQGGDIHVARGPFAALLSKDRGACAVLGEVRERRLSALPASHMYIGTTRLSLADIRAFNSLHHERSYELHVHDCRHYVNSLVAYATGEVAAQAWGWGGARSSRRPRPLSHSAAIHLCTLPAHADGSPRGRTSHRRLRGRL